MPTVDLSLGYQMLHIPGQNYPLGMAVGLSGALNEMVRIVGEVGVSINQQTASNLNGTLTMYHYGVGPRVTATAGRVQPCAQVLAGGVHTRADLTTTAGAPFSASDNAFMLQPGAGVVVPLTRTFAAIGEMNYRRDTRLHRHTRRVPLTTGSAGAWKVRRGVVSRWQSVPPRRQDRGHAHPAGVRAGGRQHAHLHRLGQRAVLECLRGQPRDAWVRRLL